MAESVVPKMVISEVRVAPTQPSLTYSYDPDTHRISGMVDGAEAVAQWARHAITSHRHANIVYSPQYGSDIYKLLANSALSPDLIESEIKREVREALSPDERITGVGDITVTFEDDYACVEFDMSTTFGDVHIERTVL